MIESSSSPSGRVLSLTSRLLLFLLALLVLAALGVWLMVSAQEKLVNTASRIHEVLLPTSRLIEQAERELDLQIHELRWLSASQKEIHPEREAKLVSLPPSVRTLLNLQAGPFFPEFLSPLLAPWAQTARAYESERPKLTAVPEVLARLDELRQRTQLLSRAVKREFSLQILLLSNSSRESLSIWGGVLLLQATLVILFVLLVWRWMAPLIGLERWLVSGLEEPSLLAKAPPRSVVGSGLMSPPLEVQSLTESFRQLVGRLQAQTREIAERSARIREDERASITLLAGLQQLVRHNEALMQELLEKEKLASMSAMAAQLAHEIRNPLNSLNLKLELLRESADSDELRKQLDAVLGEIDRLDALTESHLRTTRARLASTATAEEAELELDSETSALPELVAQSTIETLRPEFESRGIRVELSAEARGLSVPVPQNVLKAVLLNLLKNAAEAFDGPSQAEAAGGRRIRIALKSSPDRWQLRVSDNGAGFPGELREPAAAASFEAFRTTKPGGSGLGLATSQNMLRAYGVELRLARSSGDDLPTTLVVTGPLRQERRSGVESTFRDSPS